MLSKIRSLFFWRYLFFKKPQEPQSVELVEIASNRLKQISKISDNPLEIQDREYCLYRELKQYLRSHYGQSIDLSWYKCHQQFLEVFGIRELTSLFKNLVCPWTESLSLESWNIQQPEQWIELLYWIRSLESLRRLDLRGCRGMNSQVIYVLPTLWPPNLEHLWLDGAELLPDAHLESLFKVLKATKLKSLGLFQCQGLDAQALMTLGRCLPSTLEELTIGNPHLMDPTLWNSFIQTLDSHPRLMKVCFGIDKEVLKNLGVSWPQNLEKVVFKTDSSKL